MFSSSIKKEFFFVSVWYNTHKANPGCCFTFSKDSPPPLLVESSKRGRYDEQGPQQGIEGCGGKRDDERGGISERFLIDNENEEEATTTTVNECSGGQKASTEAAKLFKK